MFSPDDALEAIRLIGGAKPGYRGLHAKGVFCRGTFQAAPRASELSRARHLDGSQIPALIRFSNGAGGPTQRDDLPHIRGMAIKLSLPDGSMTDISAQSARLFTSSTPDGFIELLRAARPGLSVPLRLTRFALTHPEFRRALRRNGVVAKIPASYTTLEYHALHAFQWSDARGGNRFVRYHLVPETGERFLPPTALHTRGENFLTNELQERLAHKPVRFQLRVQIAGPGDATDDPSMPWSTDVSETIGTLEITSVDPTIERDGKPVVFDPMNLTDGIAPSSDPVLRFRSDAYSVSAARRSTT